MNPAGETQPSWKDEPSRRNPAFLTLPIPLLPLLSFSFFLSYPGNDLPMDNSRLKRNVTGIFPEQITLAISSPTSMWVSWVTGDAQVGSGDAQIGSNVTALDPSSGTQQSWVRLKPRSPGFR
ncbi:hypothetical protein SLEP1_g17414 [Rubroshorea leprosula]|uniref:Uncharacterized protein n=1 Tax=Rubroshorea leprosula TaxID=152421 RepID=A0AAV5J031_9ROSI|nr:hypothetical protein SLEP1_g17414 [Rubroshorea leprosula]